LRAFAEDRGVTYDLLSDADSAVIKRFGILNTTIDREADVLNRATQKGFYGIPFPGVYVTDRDGRVATTSTPIRCPTASSPPRRPSCRPGA